MADDLPPGFSVVSGPMAVPAAAGSSLPPGFSVVQPKPSIATDVAESIPSGVARGAAETAMLPVTVGRLARQGEHWLYDKGEGLIRSIFGAGPVTPEMQAKRDAIEASMPSQQIGNTLASGQDKIREMMDAILHKPQTTPGKFAETIGEFAAPGGLPSEATRAAGTLARKAGEYARDFTGNVVLPGALSEAAGEAAAGTPLEGPARIAGALTGNAAVTGARAYNAPEMVLRRHLEGTTEPQWQEMKRLQDNATGVRVTGPEVHAQARGGASSMPRLMRVVEGSPSGNAVTGPFFAARPGQVDAAVGGMLDKIAPQSANPSTLGPRAAQAAEKAIAASPQGQELVDAIFGVGPRTTPMQAGEVIQPAIREVFERREGMRNALADKQYEAARKAPARVAVEGMQPETTTVQPAYTSIKPVVEESEAAMVPQAVPAKTETPALTSRTGPEAVQADPRAVLQFIDDMMPDARAGTQAALKNVRSALYDRGGLDTSVNGLDAVRGQIGDMINEAKVGGQMQTVDRLEKVQKKLDEVLGAVPEYASARQTFQNASEPLRPFESPGLAKTVGKDEFNREFMLPPEKVPAALSTPSEAKNFVALAPTDARAAAGNELATRLIDGATEASGGISGDRLASLLRDNQDVLASYPEVAQRLQRVVEASSGMSAARTGPVGRVAKAGTTAEAGEAILPQNPLTGSAPEAADAVTRLAAQDPEATAALVRQRLGDTYTKARTETQTGTTESAGAKFHRSVAGNPERAAVLDAVLRSLPGAKAAPPAKELMEVLQTTMRRLGEGSPTAEKTATIADLGERSPLKQALDVARTLGASYLTKAGDAASRAALRNNTAVLADMFTSPDAVQQMREAVLRGAPTVWPEALRRTGRETGVLLHGRNSQ